MSSCRRYSRGLGLLLLCTAQINAVQDGPWGGYGFPTGGLVIDASDKHWKDGVEASNASSVFTMSGRDVSKAWPSTAITGWKMYLAAVDLTPTEVGYDLRITAPETLYKTDNSPDHSLGDSPIGDHGNGKIVNVNNDWVLCSWLNFGPPYDNASRALNPKNIDAKSDGDCSPWLSAACIDGLEKQARTAYSMSPRPQQPYGARASCGDIIVPKECEDTGLVYLNGAFGTPDLPIRFLTGPTTYQGGWTIRNDQDTPLEDTPLMWNSLTRDYMAVITMFGRYSQDNVVEPGFAKMSCIRPEKTTSNASSGSSSGSDSPGSDGSDSDGSGSDSGDSGPSGSDAPGSSTPSNSTGSNGPASSSRNNTADNSDQTGSKAGVDDDEGSAAATNVPMTMLTAFIMAAYWL